MIPTEPTVTEPTVAAPADRPTVVGSLVAAFPHDPVLRYLFPDDAGYPRHAAVFFGHLFDRRVAAGTIWTIGGVAVAMWESPAWEAAQSPGDQPDIELPRAEADRLRAYDASVHAALPAAPFWYLGVLGTHPAYAGRRWGRAVMAAGLRRAAADGLPAVLETSNPDNVGLYQRAGWEVVRRVAEPLDIWVMRYPPR